MNNFEAFLRQCVQRGDDAVRLVPRICKHGKVHFHAHGQGDLNTGDTFDAIVEGKHVRRIMDVQTLTPLVEDGVFDDSSDVDHDKSLIRDFE